MDISPLEALVRLAWLLASVAFVIGLSRMNSPATAHAAGLNSALARCAPSRVSFLTRP